MLLIKTNRTGIFMRRKKTRKKNQEKTSKNMLNNILQIRKLNEDFVGNMKLRNIIDIFHPFSTFI